MAEFPSQHLKELVLFVVGRGHRDVSALRGDDRRSVFARYECRDAQTGAGSDHRDGCAFDRLAAVYGVDFVGLQERHRHGVRGKIVQDAGRLEAETVPQPPNRNGPVRIGQNRGPVRHRTGHRDSGPGDLPVRVFIQEAAERVIEGGEIGGPEIDHIAEFAGTTGDGEPGVCPADISEYGSGHVTSPPDPAEPWSKPGRMSAPTS